MKHSRHFLVMLLLLAYTGQSLAAIGAPCFMMPSPSQDSAGDRVAMDHSGHDMSGHTADSGSDCCDGVGFCSMSECQSVVAMPLLLPPGLASEPMAYRAAPSVSAPTFHSSSLYRPPIFA